MSQYSWVVERTLSTHNHPTRYWETSVLCPISGLVATSSSDTEDGSKQLANLIAAAPDLLEALKMMVVQGGPLGTFGEHAFAKAKAAIAKAEGGAQ